MALSVIYMIYLLIDIQLVMGGKRNNLTMDNYVMGAIIIYVDIVRLFVNILRILGKKKDDWFICDDFLILYHLTISMLV